MSFLASMSSLERLPDRTELSSTKPEYAFNSNKYTKNDLSSHRRNISEATETTFSLNSSPWSDRTSTTSLEWSCPDKDSTEDDLYNVTDDESVEVPLSASNSVKERAGKVKLRIPSLIIPSPTKWPQPPHRADAQPRSDAAFVDGLSVQLQALQSRLEENSSSTRASTPSLAECVSASSEGSSSPDRASSLSFAEMVPETTSVSAPARLDPSLLEQLARLMTTTTDSAYPADDKEYASENIEMMQTSHVDDATLLGRSIWDIPKSSRASSCTTEPISAISVPSPGGFFASLPLSYRQTWCLGSSPSPVISTGTAEAFYDLPWRAVPDSDIRDDVHLHSSDLVILQDVLAYHSGDLSGTNNLLKSECSRDPTTSLQPIERTRDWLHSQWLVMTMLRTGFPPDSLEDSVDILASMRKRVRDPALPSPAQARTAGPRTDRTSVDMRSTMISPSREKSSRSVATSQSEPKVASADAPRTPPSQRDQTPPQPNSSFRDLSFSQPRQKLRTHVPEVASCFSPETPATTQTRRKVSFDDSPMVLRKPAPLERMVEDDQSAHGDVADECEDIFLQGFKHIHNNSRPKDTFLHAKNRLQAFHTQSNGLTTDHVSHLQGQYALRSAHRPVLPRPISNLMVDHPGDDAAKHVQNAIEQERQVLSQVEPAIWTLQCARAVFGSPIIAAPVIPLLRSLRNAQVLDYATSASCDWGWSAALLFPRCTVTTLTLCGDNGITSRLQWSGPANHCVVRTTSRTRLPFADKSFDLISARTLHAIVRHVKNKAQVSAQLDPLSDLLAEFVRVLKPGGHLEFCVFDATMLNAGPHGKALSSDFSTRLERCGYDPFLASKGLIPAMLKQGSAWAEIKRAWMVLPCGDVAPRWTDPVDGPLDTASSLTDSPASMQGRAREDAVDPATPSPPNSVERNVLRRRARTVLAGSRASPWQKRKDSVTHSDIRRAGVVLDSPDANAVRDQIATARIGVVGASDRASPLGQVGAEAEGPQPVTQTQIKQSTPTRRNYAVRDATGRMYEPPLTGSTKDASALTGLVGARAWEAWMVGFEREVGGDEAAAVLRASRAVAEGGKCGAGWRCLVGWARKA